VPKREKWKDDPATEIYDLLPQWDDEEMSIDEFQMAWRATLYSPTGSHIPDVLRERRPLQVIFQAALKAHENNKRFKFMLGDVSVASRLRHQLEELAGRSDQIVLLAREDPQNEMLQRDVLDVIMMALRLFRAMYNRTSPTANSNNEVTSLITWVSDCAISSFLDYVIDVDNKSTGRFNLWGDRHTAELATCGGGLATLLPRFVRRLSPSMQDRAIAYFNDVIRSYSTMPDESKPRSLAVALSRITERNDQLFHERPDFAHMRVVDANYTDPDGLRRIEAFASRQPRFDPATRMLTVPDDLSVIADAGLLPTLWRTLIQRMAGTYSKMNLPPQPHGTHVADALDDDEHDMLPVQTRNSRPAGGAGVPPATPEAGGSPAAARPRGVRFGPEATTRMADQIEKAAKSASEQFHGGMEKVTSKLEGELQKTSDRFDKMERRIDGVLQRMREDADRVAARSATETAHMIRTAETLFQNIAKHSTDLKHRDKLTESASELGARARDLERASSGAAVAAAHVAAAQVSGRQRAADAEGFYNSHVPPNEFDKFSPMVKSIYKSRDGVTCQAEYERIHDRKCMNCPEDAANMPHRQKHCSLEFTTGKDAEAKINKARIVRATQRIKDNEDRLKGGQPATYVAMVALARAMDDGDSEDAAYHEACIALADLSGLGDDPSATADAVIAAAVATASEAEHRARELCAQCATE
jgi:hypothetical protein